MVFFLSLVVGVPVEELIAPTPATVWLDTFYLHLWIKIFVLTGWDLIQREVLHTFEVKSCCLKIACFGSVLGLFLRSEEHTSELQSRENLVCRLLLEKKKSTNSSN